MSKLGMLYRPSGLALETAQAVFETVNVHACNVAWGCTNRCKDCYIRWSKPGKIRFPKDEPRYMVEKQLDNGLKTDGVFISFNTDPLLQCNSVNTIKLVCFLKQREIPIAVLSKRGTVPIMGSSFLSVDNEGVLYKKIRLIKHGMTIKSLDEKFRNKFEPRTMTITDRIRCLWDLHDEGEYTWVSDEPHPCPDIYKQDDYAFWESINFVDFIIFGKWNYNPLASTEKSREYYSKTVPQFIDFCKDHGIRYHVKAETMKFIRKDNL